MKSKKMIAAALAAMLVGVISGCGKSGQQADDTAAQTEQPADTETEETSENAEESKVEPEAVTLEKCTLGNPIAGDPDNLIYGGDPSVLVDGDTVYLYTGNDASTDEEVKKATYNIPGYLCYESKDMVNWESKGSVMTMDTVTWASNDTSAWASQVAKHFDSESQTDKYYMYYCTWDKTGKQSIGVAVSSSPTGPFEDIGQPLVKGSTTKPATSTYNDIDPTVWIETDDDGNEHRYLAWGNGIFYICELNEDMISVTDVNGDGKITSGKVAGEDDILAKTTGLTDYTEAPWLYRRQDENGNYYGDYYLFFAHKWRECMAYATTDDLMNGQWSETQMIMLPTTTSNTNHLAVCDFKGETYFIYHNGSLPKGNGYRRSACVRKLEFEDDGSVKFMEETSAGVGGSTVAIENGSGEKLGHENFDNSISDSDYPYVDKKVGMAISDKDADCSWVLRRGKADMDNENYVSIESENKSGLYITAKKDGTVVLMQDTKGDDSMYEKQTFKTVKGLADPDGISFESVKYPGEYLTVEDGILTRSDGSDSENSTFYIK